MPVTDDETLFSRSPHGNPKDIRGELSYLAASANFLIFISEKSASVAREFETRKPVLHKPRGGCVRKLRRAKHEHGRALRLGLARHVIEQIRSGDAFGKRNATPQSGDEHVWHPVGMNGVGLQEERALTLVDRASMGDFAIGLRDISGGA